jgi:hypothetical protein
MGRSRKRKRVAQTIAAMAVAVGGFAVAGLFAGVGLSGGPYPTSSTVPSTTVPTTTVPTTTVPRGDEGCTPGFWKVPQHLDSWVGFSPNQTLESVFNVPDQFGLDNVTLLQALSLQGGPTLADKAALLLHQAVAALLNSAHPDVDFPRSTADVIADVNAALASGSATTILNLQGELDADNNLGCPLS